MVLTAEEYVKAGNLEAALRELQSQIRREPSKPKLRVFLFQLLSILGQWDRALNQLNVAGELDAGSLAMVQTYLEAIRCEVLRADVFSGRRSPLVLGEPNEWLALQLEALRLSAAGHVEESQEIRTRALDLAPPTPGTIDGAPFQWVADADIRLGPVLEAIVNGRYYWIPFQHIQAIEIERPADLRDLVWMPAYFTLANGGQTAGLIPTRYAGTENSQDMDLCRSAKTEWVEQTAGVFLGVGQRMLTTDAGEYPLMDVRNITIHSSDTSDRSCEGMDSTDSEGSGA